MTNDHIWLREHDLSIEIVGRMRPVSKPGHHIYEKTWGFSAYYAVGDWAYTSCTLPNQEEAIRWLITQHCLMQAKTPTRKYVQLPLF